MTQHSCKNNQPLLTVGRVIVTAGAFRLLGENQRSFLKFLQRHRYGDWGDLEHEDKEINNHALLSGERILSSYNITEVDRLWIITEADRSITTILVPDEY